MRAPYNRPKGTSKPPGTPRKRQSLIGNDMHSHANTIALQCATSIFLIGNEFHLHSAASQRIFSHASPSQKYEVAARITSAAAQFPAATGTFLFCLCTKLRTPRPTQKKSPGTILRSRKFARGAASCC